MFKNVIKEIQQKPLGYLTAVCARPGDGRMTFAVEFANELARRGEVVYFCCFSRTKNNLQHKLLSSVRVLAAFPDDETCFLKRLNQSVMTKHAFIIVDNLQAVTIKAPLEARKQIWNNILAKLKETAIKQDMHIIVTKTLSSTGCISAKEELPLCDNAYLIYKNNITPDNAANPNNYMLKIRKIK